MTSIKKADLKKLTCIDLVLAFFENNEEKTLLWFDTKNPLLGNISPLEMVRNGRLKKLRNFILDQLEGNTP